MSEPLDPDMFSACQGPPLPMRMNNKWGPKIITCLKDGKRRFSELQVPLKGITPKVLSESLRAMERDGFLTRTSYPGVPPRVEYELTELGRSTLEPMEAWCAWAEQHLAELVDARAAYDDAS
ncbi:MULTISPECIES: helix-turn-helix domain-containing protein [Kitasatospora]|uniref:Putative HxlR family transcriptional regulator n=1 Tax=Kitasatospora setae (strain ATCC 33774 / DSM 43861 / JCM 3304 / KCC A-0304 / NBRC 14216 / KM-6054) TaxID=452652 RepID=E4N2B4_KITSK|nr:MULTISPECIES: helix-turn-helix domain-containing protein [Kitasatospora]BAJ32298.1 putative HxlR family transcriptional regulator [Kitasatospora setae KM-6054]